MTRPDHKPANRRFVRYPQLKTEYGIPWSRMHCDRVSKAGKFARKIHLSPNTVGFWSDEIEAFFEARSAAQPEKIVHP
jgi:predicted DNA-binding transcriptional regulator AlpA